jgi:uncharacterized protein (DUF4415 family)
MPITKHSDTQKVRVQLCLDRDLVETFRARSNRSLSSVINTVMAMFLKGETHGRE